MAPLSRESFGVEIQSPLNSRKATCLHFFRDQCTWDHFCCPLSGSSQKVRFERGSLRIFEPLNGVFVTSLGTFYKLNRVPVNLLVPLEAGKAKKCDVQVFPKAGSHERAAANCMFPGRSPGDALVTQLALSVPPPPPPKTPKEDTTY